AAGAGQSWRYDPPSGPPDAGASRTTSVSSPDEPVTRGAVRVIAASRLTKRYGTVTAVDGGDLRVDAGGVYALLGLNGAGKTTTIRMLLGMIRPTGGTVTVLGAPVTRQHRSVWARVGYLVETPAAYPELTVRENLEVVRRLRRLPERRAVDEVIER